MAEAGLATLAKASAPGAFLVDIFPSLRHIPDWFPGLFLSHLERCIFADVQTGAGFKTKAKEWRKYSMAMREMPFDAAKRNIVRLLHYAAILNLHAASRQMG